MRRKNPREDPGLLFGGGECWTELLSALIAALFIVGVMVGIALLLGLLPGG